MDNLIHKDKKTLYFHCAPENDIHFEGFKWKYLCDFCMDSYRYGLETDRVIITLTLSAFSDFEKNFMSLHKNHSKLEKLWIRITSSCYNPILRVSNDYDVVFSPINIQIEETYLEKIKIEDVSIKIYFDVLENKIYSFYYLPNSDGQLFNDYS